MAYIYKHIRKDTNEVFYIGIGKTKNRYKEKAKRNEYWNRIVNKVGFEYEIIEDGLSWDVACEREVYWIKYYGRKDLNEGNLVNMTDGGESTCGRIHTIETIEKIRNSKIGSKNPNYNKTFSEETITKMKNSHTGKKRGAPTEETKEKIRLGNLNKVISMETRIKMKEARKKYLDNSK